MSETVTIRKNDFVQVIETPETVAKGISGRFIRVTMFSDELIHGRWRGNCPEDALSKFCTVPVAQVEKCSPDQVEEIETGKMFKKDGSLLH